jgi:hypothetical protein
VRLEFEFGKVVYEKGAPKNLPKWIWRCTCGCGTFNGPFRALREAELDAEATALRGAELLMPRTKVARITNTRTPRHLDGRRLPCVFSRRRPHREGRT